MKAVPSMTEASRCPIATPLMPAAWAKPHVNANPSTPRTMANKPLTRTWPNPSLTNDGRLVRESQNIENAVNNNTQ